MLNIAGLEIPYFSSIFFLSNPGFLESSMILAFSATESRILFGVTGDIIDLFTQIKRIYQFQINFSPRIVTE